MTKKRFVAHIIIEADAPFKVGSNAMDFLQDSPVQKDWNGLPMILGTSIAGVLRKEFGGDKADIFGKENGSKVIVSNALLCINDKNEVCEKLLTSKPDFLKIFDNLPIREHAAIDDKGVTRNGAKFDEEVVYKGTRFKFSIEFIEEDKNPFEAILNLLSSHSFRLGGGSTKGFGKFKIIEIKSALVDLESFSSSLNNFNGDKYAPKIIETKYTQYTLTIKPDDFFMFGSGFGDSDADMTPVFEKVVDYEKGELSDKQVLIPASSIKGAIAHRTTYHYNRLNKLFIGNSEAKKSIASIFGKAKNSKQKIDGSQGKLLISDCFKVFDEAKQTKIFDHVSIDRFTGGAIEGALFQEKTVAKKDDSDWYEIEILLEKIDDEVATTAFESALKDITTGMLSLGGATTKGHGVFNGEVLKSGVAL
jgi:CRISPR/Cas system CSM-associated protein Csm3 (group 7 of RAMP superfamily)